MSTAPLLFQADGAIRHIRFNRPEALNAIDRHLASAFLDACRQLADDPEVRAVVISGNGRGFMAGGDIAQFRDDPASVPDTLIEPMNQALGLLARLDAPVLASLHGPVAGAGLSLALACDLAIAADNTRFNFAYLNLGASCDVGASWHLPRLVGLRKALEIALLSEPIDADEALRQGLVNRVVPAYGLEAATLGLARRLAAAPPRAQGLLKRLLRDSSGNGLDAQLEAEKAAFGRCLESEDFREAVDAFLEKRPAQFTGR
ncbi:enoyl-CoA hydratase-related protein [Pseudomonas sp. MOB-449]|nr:enoyl-CoA hydratase-related protein [Pseudomonas sp. MOB-449]